ncbi:MAG TPA: aminoacyl-tRNA hydrolase [Bacteroidota bacterium]|nr:aminoacyl-tRNA hydrolase [Bacteroidota bacterium]
MDAALIVGLGNPGAAYRPSRHNVGFMVADLVAARLGAPFREGPGQYLRASGRDSGVTISVIKPLTFMNLSGEAVREALRWTGVDAARALIVLDDFHLPLGALRMRAAGSDGGHRGLGSVIAVLGTEAVPRLRCGIAGRELPAREERRAFVLAPFAAAEAATAAAMVTRGAEAARAFACDGLPLAMSRHNTT